MRLLRVGFSALLLCLLITMTVYADGDLYISGPETIYPREVFEIELRISRADVTKISFETDFDQAYLEMLELVTEDNSAWRSVPTMKGFSFERTHMVSEQEQAVFRIRLRLKTVDSGTRFCFWLRNVVLWAGEEQFPVGDLCWEQTAAEIISDDNFLAELKLSDCVLSPEFSPYQLNYSATVSHHVAQVAVMAITRDDGASVKVDSPMLEYGKPTDVTVTVTAADGSIRVYTIAVTREDAPDRMPSNNCDLESLEVTDYQLSPKFAPGITDYVLWLPYETTSVEILATPADSRATVTVAGNKGFKAGQDNPILVTCTAEDGTQKIYVITAKRAETYVPQSSETGGNDAPAGNGAVYTAAENVPTWVYIVVVVAAVTGCAAVGILIADRKK